MRITIDGKRYECNAAELSTAIDLLSSDERRILSNQLTPVDDKPRGRAKSYSPKQAATMLELRNSGWTFQRIAAKYRISVGAVQRAIKDAESSETT